MGATAKIVTDSAEIARVGELMLAKFPQIKALPEPDLSTLAFLKFTAKVISVLDYTKGFGHTELVRP
jgi:hypothetical protein